MNAPTPSRRRLRRVIADWRLRFVILALAVAAAVTVGVTNKQLTQRYTESTRNRAEVRLALYSGNLLSELQSASIVPLLLSRDPALIGALNSGDFSQTSQRLISYIDEIGVASLMLLDREGRVVAATTRELLGSNFRSEPYMVQALRSSETVFTSYPDKQGIFQFSYARKIAVAGRPVGVIVVTVDLRQFEQGWAGFSDAVFVTDSEGTIILATEGQWRGKTEADALARARRALGHPSRPATDRRLGRTAGRRIFPWRRRHAARGPDSVPGLAHDQLHHLRIRAREGERGAGA